MIGADFNGHVGEGNKGDEDVMCRFGIQERNAEGQMVVRLCKKDGNGWGEYFLPKDAGT